MTFPADLPSLPDPATRTESDGQTFRQKLVAILTPYKTYIEALGTKVGATSSTDPSSLDYKVARKADLSSGLVPANQLAGSGVASGTTFLRGDRTWAVPAGGGGGGGGSSGGATFINVVTDFGADPTGAQDSTTMIQNAINALPANTFNQASGGTVFFPRGEYRVDGTLSAKGTSNVTLLGESAPVFKGVTNAASSILFGASGYVMLVDARSTQGFVARNMGFYYTNSAFTGDMFNFAHQTPTSADSAYTLFDNCVLHGPIVDRDPITNAIPSGACPANSLINFQESIFGTVRNCLLAYAQRGIVGKNTGPFYTGSFYSNAYNIQNSYFNGMVVGGVCNAGQSWNITGCGFEGPIMGHAYYDDLGVPGGTGDGSIARGGSFIGNWCGDTTPTQTASWIGSTNSIWGWTIEGNLFSGSPVLDVGARSSANNSLQGIVVQGNDIFWEFGNSINAPAINLHNWVGNSAIIIQGNNFTSVGTTAGNIVNTTNVSKLRIQANFNIADLVQ